MNLMLTVIFASVILGLVARRIGEREQAAIVVMAIGMAGLYFFARRFM